MNSETRSCQNCKQDFRIDPEDFDFYKKIEVPPPTFCPECRLVRRLAFRNERSLYRNECRKCGKAAISIFPRDSGINVYCRPCWWSDAWDGLEYGMDFDPNVPFMAQVRQLLGRVPIFNLIGNYPSLENSEHTNMVGFLKNCYLVTYSDYCENCIHGSFVEHSKDCVENLMINSCELCYECVNCDKCYRALYSVDCESCHDVLWCKNCVGCSDCIGCTNLKNKRYCIFNKQYTKEEYEKLASEYQPDSFSKIEEMRTRALAFWKTFPQKYMHGQHNTSVSGDYLFHTKNTSHSFIVTNSEDCKFCAFIAPGKLTSSYDFTHFGENADLIYDTFNAGYGASNIRFSCWAAFQIQDVEYSFFCAGGAHLLGCVGLKKKEYCILNKQYSKEEYEKLRAAIVAQMQTEPYQDSRGNVYRYGEFFPVEMSPFGYNATTAQEFFPLTKEEILQRGYPWKEQEQGTYQITVDAESIPGKIDDVPDSSSEEIFGCEHQGKCNEQCSTAFRIIPQELQFYRRLKLPLPHLCPNCRHHTRLKFRNPMKLWARKCQCAAGRSENGDYANTAQHFHGADTCPNEFQTSYAPERPEIVYCEQCYQAEVA